MYTCNTIYLKWLGELSKLLNNMSLVSTYLMFIYMFLFFRSSSSGDSEKDKWILYGVAGAIGIISLLAFYNMSYKEITWKDFVNK